MSTKDEEETVPGSVSDKTSEKASKEIADAKEKAKGIIAAAQAKATTILETAEETAKATAAAAIKDPEADPVPTESELNMERQLEQQEKTLKQQLDAMEKVPIEIPEDPNNPDDVVPVGWNGIIYAIPRGQQFMVPKVIYEIWKESHTKTQAINKRVRDSVEKEIKVME